MKSHRRGFLVITDLDGTLLDDSYDMVNAARAMDQFNQQDNHVIPASSKTLQELHQLNELRAQPSPLIFENGAGIAYPAEAEGRKLPYRCDGQGPAYPELCSLLNELRSSLDLKFEGFHDLTDAQVAQHTGLTLAAAQLAKQRLFSEPLLWQGSDAEQQNLSTHLEGHNLQLISGGRFLHVMPKRTKGDAAEEVAATLNANQSTPRWHIACGDSENDEPLLRWADAFVLFPKRDGKYLELRSKHCLLAAASGTNEWVKSLKLLTQTLSTIKE